MQLLADAEKQLDDSNVPAPSTSPVRVDRDKHAAVWKRRVRILRKMKAGLEQLSKCAFGRLFKMASFQLCHSFVLIFPTRCRAAAQPEPGTSGSGRRAGGAHLVAPAGNRLRRRLHEIQR